MSLIQAIKVCTILKLDYDLGYIVVSFEPFKVLVGWFRLVVIYNNVIIAEYWVSGNIVCHDDVTSLTWDLYDNMNVTTGEVFLEYIADFH